jgi:hypothetical protein
MASSASYEWQFHVHLVSPASLYDKHASLVEPSAHGVARADLLALPVQAFWMHVHSTLHQIA